MSFIKDFLIRVDTKHITAINTPTFVQGESAKLRFKVYDNNVLYDLTGFTRAEIIHKLPSGDTLVGDAILNSDGEIEYDYPTKTELAEIGNVKVLLNIYSGSSMISIQPFNIYVFDSFKGESMKYVSLLQDLIKNVQYLEVEINQTINEANKKISEITTLHTTINSNETARKTAETTRVSNENTRKSNENARQSSESTRISNESLRENSENNRKTEESSRVSNENTRISNETARQTSFNNKINEAQTLIDNTKSTATFNLSTAYKKNNIVLNNGSSWIALKDTVNNPLPTLPTTENLNWRLVAQRGVDGNGAVSKINNISPDINGKVILTNDDVGAVSSQNFTEHSTDSVVHNQYGTSSSSTSTIAKIVTYSGFILKIGSRITVKFANGNTAANPTLNVNSTGAKPIYQNGTVGATWSAGEVVEFVYDGTNWCALATTKAISESLDSHIGVNASKTQFGHIQVGDGLNVNNGVVSANFHYDATKTLDTPSTEFLNGETITSINTNSSDAVQQVCIALLNTLMGYSITGMLNFRFVLRTVKRGTIVNQELIVYSNFPSSDGLEIMRFNRVGSFLNPYNWGDWRINLTTISYNGSPNGTFYGMVGWLLYDIMNYKLYKKTTGTNVGTNTGWVELGGAV